MRTLGLVFMPEPTIAALVIGGISVLERQVRLLRRAGATAIFVVDMPPLAVIPVGSEPVTVPQLADLIAETDRVLILSRGLVVDERVLAAMARANTPALLVADATLSGAQGVERLDALTLASGVAVVDGATLATIARTLGDWDLEAVVTRTLAADSTATRVEFSSLPLYAPARRREVPMLWARPQSEIDAAALDGAIVAAAQKGCLDWPARFIHPPIENFLVRLLAPTSITPNMVTLATGVVGIGAAFAFATGWLWLGLILALLTGPLDGVDGKLARTRVEYSRFGDLEHLLDKSLEYAWYLCIGAHFATTMHSALPWAIAALIILPALCEAIQGEFFRRFTGRQLDDAGVLERRIRLIAGRRNTFLWTWLVFAAAGAWLAGFVVLAAYSIVTTGIAQWRFYRRIGDYSRTHAAAVADNFRATDYDFLPYKTVTSK